MNKVSLSLKMPGDDLHEDTSQIPLHLKKTREEKQEEFTKSGVKSVNFCCLSGMFVFYGLHDERKWWPQGIM